jgi:hypothetical protein
MFVEQSEQKKAFLVAQTKQPLTIISFLSIIMNAFDLWVLAGKIFVQQL